MCLIIVGWRVHADFPLIVAANRDEFYARPTAAAGRWPEVPQVLGGRDLEAGGTWLGISDTGRFAAVTNVREPGMPPGQRSRGDLTREFLLGTATAAAYAEGIDGTAFAGFNLLVADGEALYYRSNRHGDTEKLAPGIYGLSNHRLDTPWPKLLTARQRFSQAIAALPDTNVLTEPGPFFTFFELLADAATVDDANLPKTGVSLEWERRLSAIFVKSADYGTRASTVLLQHANGRINLHERSFGPHGQPLQFSQISTGV
jgi:uncharacterized protein with NRDE domain